MDFMQWAVEQASEHPDLANAVVTADGEWLAILLADGRTFRFRPGALIKEDAPAAERAELLSRLLSIGVQQAVIPPKEADDSAPAERAAASPSDTNISSPAESSRGSAPAEYGDASSAETHTAHSDAPEPDKISFEAELSSLESARPLDESSALLPIVRGADYFLASHQGNDSMVYVPLTDFIGAGIAQDLPGTIRPIYYSQLENNYADAGDLLAQSVANLRGGVGHQRISVEVGISKIAGAEVVVFLSPENYELSWLCDVELLIQVAERLSQRHADSIPLFVPAARTKLYVVFSEDPHLADFFKLLLAQRANEESVYPLPHTLAADGWREWIPFPGSPLAEVLGALRTFFQGAMYAAQVEAMALWEGSGALKAYEAKRTQSGERVSVTEWNSLDAHGSIPHTDFVTIVREASPHPWEADQSVRVTLRSHVAREIWQQGFERDANAWPPRWNVSGFPDEATLELLISQADREF